MMRLKFIFLLVMMLISVDTFSQRYYIRDTYPLRDCYYNRYPRRVIVQCPQYENVVVVREPERVIHIENVQRERIYVHNKVEREYINVNDNIIEDEVYVNGINNEAIIEDDYIQLNDMWEIPIHFKINSAIISDEIDRNTCASELSIFSVVTFMKKNPYTTITLYAYSDILTGTERDNYYLAKQRGIAVYESLVSKYRISPNRVKVKIMGSETQYYSTNRWNRCVIIKAN